jgi:hypothetical protein
MLWRSVQVEEPRSSTSGGQFEGVGVMRDALFVDVEEEGEAVLVVVLGWVDFRIIAIHADEDVQLRHLYDLFQCFCSPGKT